MANIRELLNQVWSLYRKAGITDDIAVLNNIADMLLTLQKKQPLRESRASITTDFDSTIESAKIRELLDQAIAAIVGANAPQKKRWAGAGKLFDRYTLFRLDRILRGGRYPTPRHIVRHMVHLAQVKPKHSLADFACGSGGFLVYAPRGQGFTLGVEISPEWANLARANTRLHDIQTTVIAGNALREFAKSSVQQFDRVLMNPPFGESIEADLAEKAVGFATGSSSETALTALALKSLAPGGRLAVLVPSGVLQNNSRGEKALRTKLLNEYLLEAVVTFPRDAFQPFSKSSTHLLLAHNKSPQPASLTWFFKAGDDGYNAGHTRDLTGDPELPNDLLLIENLYQASHQLVTKDSKPLQLIKSKNGGHIVRAVPAALLLSARYYAALDQAKAFVLIVARHENNQTTWQLSIEASRLIPVLEDLEAYLRAHYRKQKKDQPKPITLFQNQIDKESLGEVLALAPDGKRLLGVAVLQENLRRRYYDLDPEQYLKAPIEEVVLRPPSELLRDIRESQLALSQRVDNLLGWVIPSGGTPRLPSPVSVGDDPLISQLNPEQQVVWQRIRMLLDDVTLDGGQAYQTGRYFKPDASELADITDPAVVEMTLDILEQMGLIVLVTQENPLTHDKMPFYRLVEERDTWKLEPQGENQGAAQ